MVLAASHEQDLVRSEIVRLIDDQLASKTFSSGSRGYLAMGKVVVGDKRYMVNVQAVEIGSKPR